jgi:hypothetical protein
MLALLPATPRASNSLLFSEIFKDSLMREVKSPRIIFVGGSNLSLGFNSEIIKDSLELYPINTAIHAGIGLKYMMDNSLKNIRENDIIILIPEYTQYIGDYFYGSQGQELTRMIFDINKNKIHLLNLKQILNVFKILPKYSISKLNPKEYFKFRLDPIYGKNSFNEFGDAYKHWNLSKLSFLPYENIGSNINDEVFKEIKIFEQEILLKKAKLYVSFPGIQEKSFQNSKASIKLIENQLKKSGFQIIGLPESYILNDSLFYDTPYHLRRRGVDLRTNLFLEDFKSKIK